MLKAPRSLHLILSSTPDSLAYGKTTAQKELDIVCGLPCWKLSVGLPELLFRLDTSQTLPDTLPLCEIYRARLGPSVRFGAWLDVTTRLSLSSYVVAAHALHQLCESTNTENPTFLVSTLSPQPFSALDTSLPVGLGALSQAVPVGTALYLSCPETTTYTLLASLLNVPILSPMGPYRLTQGEEALLPRQGIGADVMFLAPWWGKS